MLSIVLLLVTMKQENFSYKSFSFGLITALSVIGFMFIFTVIHANWSAPTTPPPGANVAAPINTSNSSQFKASGGEIGADFLTARTQVQSDRYCNQAGTECLDFSELGGGTGGGTLRPCQVTGYGYRCFGNNCGRPGYTYRGDVNLIHGQFASLPLPGLTFAERWGMCPNYHSIVRGSVQCLDGNVVLTSQLRCVYTGGP